MKKTTICLLALLFMILLPACTLSPQAFADQSGSSPAPSAVPSVPVDTPVTTQTAPPTPAATAAGEETGDGQEVAMGYVDAQLDMQLTIMTPGWEYYKDREIGQVYFYPREGADDITMISISADTVREAQYDAEKLVYIIEYVWAQQLDILEPGFASFSWEKQGGIMVGSYKAAVYHYTGVNKENGQEYWMDYVYWWTQDRLYICSFSALPDTYEASHKILVDSLATFKVLSDIIDAG